MLRSAKIAEEFIVGFRPVRTVSSLAYVPAWLGQEVNLLVSLFHRLTFISKLRDACLLQPPVYCFGVEDMLPSLPQLDQFSKLPEIVD